MPYRRAGPLARTRTLLEKLSLLHHVATHWRAGRHGRRRALRPPLLRHLPAARPCARHAHALEDRGAVRALILCRDAGRSRPPTTAAGPSDPAGGYGGSPAFARRRATRSSVRGLQARYGDAAGAASRRRPRASGQVVRSGAQAHAAASTHACCNRRRAALRRFHQTPPEMNSQPGEEGSAPTDTFEKAQPIKREIRWRCTRLWRRDDAVG